MPVHRLEIGGPDGDRFETVGVTTQNDIPAPEMTVRSGPAGYTKEVSHISQIDDNDIVNIGGMEMKASQARSLGLLDVQHAPSSNDLAREVAQQQQQALQGEYTDDAGEGEGEDNEPIELFDAVTNGLNAEIDAGNMSLEEGQAYEQIVGELALDGESVEDLIDAYEGLQDGTIDPNDVPAEAQGMIDRAERQVTEAATAAVIEELGQEGFDELQAFAKSNSHANRLIQEYAIARATGSSDGLMWSDVLEYFRQEF